MLLIACANVANMMLARAMARQREMGVRLAMGAARSRLIRQLLTESVLLALPAAIAGFGISQAATEWGVRLMFATLPRGYLDFVPLLTLQPDARVFGFMLAAAVVIGVAFWPRARNAGDAVQRDAGGPWRIHDGLPARAAARCARDRTGHRVAVLLLICAAVLLRANNRLQGLDVGLHTRGLVEIEIKDSFRAQVNQHLASDPGVQSIAAASKVPLKALFPECRCWRSMLRRRFPRGTCMSRRSIFRYSNCRFCAAVTSLPMKPGPAPRWR